MRLSRRSLLGLGAAAAGGAAVYGVRNRQKTPPQADIAAASGLNVLFVLTDQERAWNMLPSGFIDTHAPARAWLRDNGVSVSTAYAPSQLCSTARGIVYTGQHPPNNGLWENAPVPIASPLRKDIPNMGSLFRDAGYATGYAGKWHISKIEQMPPGERVREEIQAYGFTDTEVTEETDGALVGMARDGETVNQALRYIERHKDESQPWFLAVNLLNPHDIMYYSSGPEMQASRRIQFPDRIVRPPSEGLYAEDLGYDLIGHWGPATRGGRPAAIAEYARAMETNLGFMPFDDIDVAREFQNYYWNCIRDCDAHLMNLLDGLRASGELERTVIVFTSDHGEFLGVHGLRGKGVSPYKEASHIPFVIVHPDGDRGVLRDGLSSHVDLVPTLLGLAGANVAALKEQFPELVGFDLSQLAFGDGPTERDRAGVLQHWTSMAFMDHMSGVHFKDVFDARGPQKLIEIFRALPKVDFDKRGHMRGLFDGRYKFARYFSPDDHQLPGTWAELSANNDFELYDLATDPDELQNLAGDAAHKESVLALNERLNTRIRAEIGADDGSFLPFLLTV